MADGPGIRGMLVRALAAFALVFLTYNPEGFSFFHWAIAPMLSNTPVAGPVSLRVVAGLVLIAGWAVFLLATRRSIGLAGAMIVLAICGAVVWVLLDMGIVSASSNRGLTHVILICLATLLAIGVNWSHISRRISGQVDMDPSD